MFEEFLITLLRGAELAALLALPLWLRYTVTGLMRRFDHIGYFAVPGVARLAFFAGAIFGGALLYANHLPEYYYFDTVFAQGGPWDVPFWQLFVIWMNPLRYSPLVLWERIALLDIDDTLTAFTLISAGLTLLTLAAAIFYFRRHCLPALFNSLLIWLWSAALAVYVACAAAWALNMLNFWAIVLIFLLVRHRSLAAH